MKELLISIKNEIKENKKVLLCTIPFILLLLGYYLYYLKNSMSVKTWDESCYWLNTLKVTEFNILQAIKQLIRSVNNDEYNLLSSFILQPVFFFTNKSYNSYILSIFFVCIVPTILAFSIFVSKCTKLVIGKIKLIPVLLGILTFILSPQIHRPVVYGYLDIICLIFVFLAYSVITDYDFKKFNYKKSIILGLCILMIALLRRYYMIWIVTFYISIFIIHFIYDIIKERQVKQYLLRTKNIIFAGLMSLIPILICAPLMLIRYLKSNYAGSYSAYKLSGLWGEFYNLFSELGTIPTVMCISGFILSIINKKTRKFSLFMLINFFTTIIIFNRIQSMASQHKYLIIPAILYGIFMLITCIYNSQFIQKKKYLKVLPIVIYTLLLLTNFIFANIQVNTHILFNGPILVLNNTANMPLITEIVEYIESITNDTDKKIYIIASSLKYNNETFSHYYLPDLNTSLHYSEVSHVDLVHGFNTSFYESDYVMTLTPIQHHLAETDQEVIYILYNALENESPLSDNYTLIYEKDDELTFRIYEKIKDLDEEDKQYLVDEFNKYYSDKKDLFENRILEK